MSTAKDDAIFADALQGLRRGDFSRLEPLFESHSGAKPRIVQWVEEGRFLEHDQELAEALTCACFNGNTSVAEYLLNRGITPSGGSATGLDAIHWAANRGQLQAVKLLLQHKVPLETRSMYGGTVLATAVWSATHEPRPAHMSIIEELLAAGSRVEEAGYPTGNAAVDAILRRFGAPSLS